MSLLRQKMPEDVNQWHCSGDVILCWQDPSLNLCKWPCYLPLVSHRIPYDVVGRRGEGDMGYASIKHNMSI